MLVHPELCIAREAAVREGADLEHRGARDLDGPRRIAPELESREALARVDELLDVTIELSTLGACALPSGH